MGWDAFGLPAENAAITNRRAAGEVDLRQHRAHAQPAEVAGLSRSTGTASSPTCQPDYYRWNSGCSRACCEKGIAYRKNAVVNWDPVDQTVLANEQVIDGRGWRTGALVEKREIPQWFLSITDYAQELLDGLDKLPGWPERSRPCSATGSAVREGLEIQFDVEGRRAADRLHHAPRHADGRDLRRGRRRASAGAEGRARQSGAGGVHRRTASTAASPRRAGNAGKARHGHRPVARSIRSPATQVPVWVANFVLMGYGTGAVMAVPGARPARLGVRAPIRACRSSR